jgi:hypothetical protein
MRANCILYKLRTHRQTNRARLGIFCSKVVCASSAKRNENERAFCNTAFIFPFKLSE